MKELLKKLTDVYGPTGFEDSVRALIQAEVTPYVDSVTVDALGNLHAVKNGSGEGKRIMLAAHMDEIGLMITYVEKEGFLRFTNLGGVNPVNLVNSRVVFANGQVGVINIEAGETVPAHAPQYKNLYIDVGAVGREACSLKVGDVCGFFGPAVDLGQLVMAKSLDNRLGCLVLIETIKNLTHTPHQLHFVFTVQEEIEQRGATVSAFRVEPDIAIAVDVTLSGDTPEMKNFPVYIGKGLAVKMMDRGHISHPLVTAWMIDTAEKLGLPYQREVLVWGSTDAQVMQTAKSGAAVGAISIPIRHVHTASEIVDPADVEHAVTLLTAMLVNPAPVM